MGTVTVRNRRLKMSPGGVITLPVSARRALGMEKGAGSRVAVDVDGERVVLSALRAGEDGFRVSPRGQMELRAEARELLARTPTRNYWLVADDEAGRVSLHPFGAERL
jgi:bifunctional DNA-binding transcriptional regulator/antitoxin component of YhaV-PrlF toxin-antitoxin module